jgi:hypothetical protein
MARKRGMQVIKFLMTWGLPLALLVLAWASLPISNNNITAPQTNIDPTALYYALSTIGQVAAALAALIGFLGQWWLTRLHDEETRIEQKLRELVLQDSSLVPPADLPRLTRAFLLQIVERAIKAPQGLSQVFMSSTLWIEHARLKALPDEQKRLLRTLRIFLRGTLAVMVLAIMGFVFVEALLAWPWMPWILRGFIIVASIWLGFGPAYVASVMWKEVPLPWGPLALALLLLEAPP